ncbi:Cubilin [Orchesella cincta]|uniref:Cubilin n=1 Tax=Orchesella cincta TaxID=48709 RepID=A0A1D2MFE8_ORCCI|nr:Cubilin [Orchesella cincta]
MNGSMVAIVFRSDSAYTGTGFTLRFFSRGFKSDAEKSYKSEFRHISETHGAVDFNEEEGTYDILVIASSVARRLNGPTANPIGIDWKGGLFKKANDSCTYDTIRFYEPTIYSNGGWGLQAQFPNQTESTCEGVISILEEKEFFSSDSPTFLVIYKPVASGDSDDEETGKRFEFNYHTPFGGTLRGENGRISYKESQSYINGERCIWEIEIPHAASIAFYLERSGVEACCDFVTVTSESGLTEVRLSLTNRTTIISGSKARVRFSSDSSVTGTGFRLRYENSTDLVVQDNKCGGILRGDKGTLIYKRGIEYFNNEKCIYFLHSPQSTNITLQLVDDGFEVILVLMYDEDVDDIDDDDDFKACCDYLLVNTIDPITGTLRNDTVKINRAKRTHSFEESLLVLVFSSDGGTRGRGFSLKFSGTGNNSNPEYSYKLIHTFETEGTVSFPSSVWDRAANQSETKEIFVLAHSLSIVPGEDMSTMPTNISWTSGVFKKKNDSCDYGSVTFYTFPSQTGWTTEDQYPDANDTASCTDFITVPAKRNIWSANLTAFLVIYKPIEFEQIEENTTQFSFAFEKSAGCGGVYIANSGYISYKENGYYANNEECIFLVEVPSAETIAFNLEKNGFEVCCDYISISSVDAFTGIQAPAVIISANNQTATVKGPVAIVTFTSDDSVAKVGFRLQFRMGRQMSDDAPYSYHLAHLNQPRLNHYSYEAQPNQVAIVAFSPESHRRIWRGTGFNITSFRPQVNESCYSDSFLVYNAYGRINNTVSLAKSFTASNVVHDQTFISENTARNCTSLGDSQFNPCDSIENCIDTPIGNIFRTNSSSFVAIYSSVNATGSLRFRGVAFTSGSYIR